MHDGERSVLSDLLAERGKRRQAHRGVDRVGGARASAAKLHHREPDRADVDARDDPGALRPRLDDNARARQQRRGAGESSNTFQVALGKAGGGFAPATTYQFSGSPTSILAGDSNGDGFQDLYVMSLFLELWLGHADGKLTLAADIDIAECSQTTRRRS